MIIDNIFDKLLINNTNKCNIKKNILDFRKVI